MNKRKKEKKKKKNTDMTKLFLCFSNMYLQIGK